MRKNKIFIESILLLFLILCLLIRSHSEENSAIWKTNPQKTILENGITLIHEQDFSSKRTVVHILIKGGKRMEPPGKEGLAYLTTRLVINIPDKGKIQDLMNLATRLRSDCEPDYSLINISCLTENLEDSLETTAKIMLDPLFSGLRINAIKQQMNRQRDAAEDDSIVVAYNALFDSLYGGTSYGGSIFGSKNSLDSIEKKDIETFYKNHFVGPNMIVAVSSDLEKQAIIDLISKYYKKFPTGTSPEMEPLTFGLPPENFKSIERDTEQTYVSLAFPIDRVSGQNFALVFMIENLLGKGFDSKLWPLRIKQKLAYVVDSRAGQMREGGFIEAYLETDNAKRDTALDALEKVMNDLYLEGVKKEDLETTKVHTKAYFLRNNEDRERRLSSIAYFEAMDLGYDFIIRYFDEISATTQEEMNSFIRKYLNPEKAIRLLIGPQGE